MPRNCIHSEFGCRFEETEPELDLHEVDCKYRSVSCVDRHCHSKVSMVDFFDHIKKRHGLTVSSSKYDKGWKSKASLEYCDKEITGVVHRPKIVQKNGRTFIFDCVLKKDGLFLAWVYMLGSKKDCEAYECTIKIVQTTSKLTVIFITFFLFFTLKNPLFFKKKELIFWGRCVSLDFPSENMVEDKNCLFLKDVMAASLATGGNRVELNFHFDVQKKYH